MSSLIQELDLEIVELRRKEMDKNGMEELFGKSSAYYFDIIKMITDDIDILNFEYFFVDNDSYKKVSIQHINVGMKIYWFEILERAHLCGVTAILRQNSWIKGIINSINDPNFIQFASAFRGFMEASSDAYAALRGVPSTISEINKVIRLALEEKLYDVHTSSDLEDTLIHFAHARKVGNHENVPYSHKAKTERQYLTSLTVEKSNMIHECYSELCEITHPASLSVFSFIDEKDMILRLSTKKDLMNIQSFCRKYIEIIEDIFQLSLNPLFLILKTLNLFNLKNVYTPSAENINLDKIPAWSKILKNFEQ